MAGSVRPLSGQMPAFEGVGTGRLNPVRIDAEAPPLANFLSKGGDLLGRYALGQMEREAKRVAKSADAAGKAEGLRAAQAGAPPTLRTDTDSIAGEAFNAGVATAYVAGLQVDIRSAAQRLATEHEDPQAFSQAWSSYRSGLLAKVPAELRPEVDLELMDRGSRGLGQVEEVWTGRQRQGQADTLFQSLEGLSEDYRGLMRRGDNVGASRIAEQANVLLGGMVASGHLSGAQAAKERARLADDGAKQAVLGSFEAAVRDGGLGGGLRFIEAYGQGTDGDPEFRDSVSAELRADWSRRKSLQTAAMADVTRSVQSAIEVLDKGYPVDLTSVEKRAAGTPLAAVLDAAKQDQAYVAAFAKQAPGTQAQILQDMDSRLATGLPPAAADRAASLRDRLGRTSKATLAALDDDPLAHAARVGVVDLPPVDWQAALSGDANGVRETFAARIRAADIASAQFGRPVSPLTKPETDALARVIETGDMGTKTTVLATLRNQLPDGQLGQVMATLAPKAPAFVVAAGIAPDRAWKNSRLSDGASVAADILRGEDLRRTTTGLVPSSADVLSTLDSVVGAAFAEDRTGKTRQQVVEAALSLYAARSYASGDIGAYNPDRFEAAIADVTGGVIDYHGRQILAPARGMDEDDFDDLLDDLTDDDLAGALHPTGRRLSADYLRADASFTSAGAGRYFVWFGDKTLVREDDPQRRFVLDLRPVLDRVGGR